MAYVPAYLKENLPVMTLSNFWRDTQRMKEEDRNGQLKPHLIIPNLKNHRQIGGVIPYRLFISMIAYSKENEIPLNPTYRSASWVKKMLESKKPLLENEDTVLFLTFEKKGKTPAAIMVAVGPEMFARFQDLYRSKELDPYIKQTSQRPIHYPAEQNMRSDILLRFSTDDRLNQVFTRIAPNQNRSAHGERRLVKLSTATKLAFSHTVEELVSRGANIHFGLHRMKIEGLDEGRATYADDPDDQILFQDDAVLTLRHAGKRPNSSIQIDALTSQPAVDLLVASSGHIRLRANDMVLRLAAA